MTSSAASSPNATARASSVRSSDSRVRRCGHPEVKIGKPQFLFQKPMPAGPDVSWDVSLDDRKLLWATPDKQPATREPDRLHSRSRGSCPRRPACRWPSRRAWRPTRRCRCAHRPLAVSGFFCVSLCGGLKSAATFLADPKSRSLAPDLVRITLPGLRSR